MIFFVVWLTKVTCAALFPAGTIVEILIIANLQHAPTCCKLCSSVNHYTTTPQYAKCHATAKPLNYDATKFCRSSTPLRTSL